jgi:predicted heme/steroid binding protein
MKKFTVEELEKYDGSNGIAYVAVDGKVYDVSDSFHWKKGVHQVTHHAGKDLTGALKQAPHGADLLQRVPVIGELSDS